MSAPESASKQAPGSSRFSVFALLGWAAAAILGAACLFFGTRFVQAKSESIALHQESELLRIENQSLRQELTAERIISARLLQDVKASKSTP